MSLGDRNPTGAVARHSTSGVPPALDSVSAVRSINARAIIVTDRTAASPLIPRIIFNAADGPEIVAAIEPLGARGSTGGAQGFPVAPVVARITSGRRANSRPVRWLSPESGTSLPGLNAVVGGAAS